ncbi:MAG: hypothetical protein LBB18_03865 [Puniceicoccales bacterium]|jgi:hypothetical protein|nr:hypothetical protein [Puniceicoccales bacterium]
MSKMSKNISVKIDSDALRQSVGASKEANYRVSERKITEGGDYVSSDAVNDRTVVSSLHDLAATPENDEAAPVSNATAPENGAATPVSNATAPENDEATPVSNATAPENGVTTPVTNAATPENDAATPVSNAAATENAASQKFSDAFIKSVENRKNMGEVEAYLLPNEFLLKPDFIGQVYAEKQDANSGTCGIHALNGYLGKPIFSFDDHVAKFKTISHSMQYYGIYGDGYVKEGIEAMKQVIGEFNTWIKSVDDDTSSEAFDIINVVLVEDEIYMCGEEGFNAMLESFSEAAKSVDKICDVTGAIKHNGGDDTGKNCAGDIKDITVFDSCGNDVAKIRKFAEKANCAAIGFSKAFSALSNKENLKFPNIFTESRHNAILQLIKYNKDINGKDGIEGNVHLLLKMHSGANLTAKVYRSVGSNCSDEDKRESEELSACFEQGKLPGNADRAILELGGSHYMCIRKLSNNTWVSLNSNIEKYREKIDDLKIFFEDMSSCVKIGNMGRPITVRYCESEEDKEKVENFIMNTNETI